MLLQRWVKEKYLKEFKRIIVGNIGAFEHSKKQNLLSKDYIKKSHEGIKLKG